MKYLMLIILFSSNIAFAGSFERVVVTEQEPITRNVTRRVQVGENCQSVTNVDKNSIGIDTIIGGGLGVIAGNQFHNHRAAARVGGGLIGALAANHLRGYKNSGCSTECTPVFENVQEEQIIAYNNCAYIDGIKYCKRSSRPLNYLKFTRRIIIH